MTPAQLAGILDGMAKRFGDEFTCRIVWPGWMLESAQRVDPDWTLEALGKLFNWKRVGPNCWLIVVAETGEVKLGFLRYNGNWSIWWPPGEEPGFEYVEIAQAPVASARTLN